MQYIIVLLGLFLGSIFSAEAREGYIINYQVNAGKGAMTDAKAISIGFQGKAFYLRYKTEAGGLFDHREGAKSSAFAFTGVGVEPKVGPIYLNFFQNIGGISNKSSYLGSHFQFAEEFGVGVIDFEEGSSLGFRYFHISNAGLWTPNRGVDLIGLQIQIPW